MTDTAERTVELNPALQRLIDERIDGIERALRGAGIGRAERKQVVEDVERQLLDMLAEAGPQPTRRDVLQALSRLDPPEAYLGDDAPRSTSDRNVPTPEAVHGFSSYSKLGLTCLGLLVTLAFFILVTLLGVLTDSEGILVFGGFLTVTAAIAALATGAYTLVALRTQPRRGIGLAVAAVVIGFWVLSNVAAYFLALAFRSETLLVFACITKDLPLAAALIWCWRGFLKSRQQPAHIA